MEPDLRAAVSGSPDLVERAKELFLEYARSLDFSLRFQDFEEELAELPGEYSPPSGCLIVALEKDEPIGCVALRRIDLETCEMKRLYVRPSCRAKGVGRKLAARIIDEAREIGYTRMRLDTVPAMKEAISLYRSIGFKDMGQYRPNPIPGALFMELSLKEKDEPDSP